MTLSTRDRDRIHQADAQTLRQMHQNADRLARDRRLSQTQRDIARQVRAVTSEEVGRRVGGDGPTDLKALLIF